jgi:hypothetical protein
MAILSHADYLHRWTAPAPNGFGQTICPPCYHEYLQREIYAQDFLDLYIGVATFTRTPIGACYYVKITGNPILGVLGIPLHPTLMIIHEGDEYLLVDYEYPWMGELENACNRCIQYIMIAEAAPPQNIRTATYGLNDNLNSYFYNYQHTLHTQYFTAPCSAFGILVGNKINKLIELANNGVLLLDLFPFAINYNGIRVNLNGCGTSENFLNGAYPNSITIRVADLLLDAILCNDFLLNVNAVLIAPPDTSYYIGNLINHGLVLPNLNFRLGNNTFIAPHIVHSPRFYHYIPVGTSLVGIGALVYPLIGLTKTPILASCAYGGTGLVPHYIFIKNALGLPL